MNEDESRLVEGTTDRDVYDYCAGILRSVRERGGAASLGDVRGDMAGEAGDRRISLQRLEDARQALVNRGNIYTDVRPMRDRRGIKKQTVFLVLVANPAGTAVVF